MRRLSRTAAFVHRSWPRTGHDERTSDWRMSPLALVIREAGQLALQQHRHRTAERMPVLPQPAERRVTAAELPTARPTCISGSPGSARQRLRGFCQPVINGT